MTALRKKPGAALKLAAVLVAGAALLFATACSSKETGRLVPGEYSGWTVTTDIVLDYPVPGHGNGFRNIVTNDAGLRARESTVNGRPFLEFPPGTILIKEVFDTPQKPGPGAIPGMLAVMIKAPERAEAQAGWLWVVKDMKNGAERIVDSPFCAECHASANDRHPYGDRNENREFRDYVFFPPKKGGAAGRQRVP